MTNPYLEDDEPVANLYPTHPGTMLKEKIEYLEISGTALAEAIGASRPDVTKMLNGKLAISPWLAARIEKAIDYPASILLAMQSAHDLAEITREKAERLGRIARLVPANQNDRLPHAV